MLRRMRLYNTLTKRVEDVVPVEEGRIEIYACGPTVYRYVHVGNLRTFLLTDVLRRALELEGYDVTLVQNITDVGHMIDESSAEAVDRMQLATEDEGLDPHQIAEKYTQAFLEDADAIGIRRADRTPKATDHIPDMIQLTETLVEKGHAYVVDGTVYYDVRSFPDYGKLSGNTLDKLKPGHRDIETDPRKRHHADFSLWKEAGPGRLMKWDSPWGEGFPGWHIECSAMSMKYLGDRFDIHTGGNDLKFPHHEDEIAQSESAVGHQVVSTWVHGGHLRGAGGLKMSKSSGNILRIRDLVREYGIDPLSFRYLTFQTRSIKGADRTVKRLRQRMAEWSAAPRDGLSPEGKDLDARFRERVSNDLDLPGALKVLSETVSSGIPDGDKYALLASWDPVLGLDLERNARGEASIPADVQALVAERDAARAARDFARADELRDRLTEAGYEVMDSAEGTRVRPRA